MHWMNQRKFDFLLNMIEVGIYPFDYIDLSGYELSNSNLRLLFETLDRAPGVKARIKKIDLSNNKLNSAIFENFPALKIVNLTKNSLTLLRFSNTPMVETLNVGLNLLNSIGGLSNLLKLTNLDIYGNRFKNLSLPQSPLYELDARRNLIESLDISNKPMLQTVRAEANPMRTLLIVGSPLTQHFSFSDISLDDASKVQIANHRSSMPTETPIFNVNYSNNIVEYNPHNNLDIASLTSYFNLIFRQKRIYLNKILGETRIAYGLLAMNAPANIELKLIEALSFDYLHSNLRDYINSFFSGLIKPNSTENQDHNAMVKAFIEQTLPLLLNNKMTKAKQLFYTPKLSEVISQKRPALRIELARAKNNFETNPLLFAFNTAYFKATDLFASFTARATESKPQSSSLINTI